MSTRMLVEEGSTEQKSFQLAP